MQASMERLGEALASKLDKDALLKIVVQTAVEGVAADGGRASFVGSDRISLEERASAGNLNGLHAAVQGVEAEAMRSGSPRETSNGDAHVMAHPLRPADGTGSVVGVVSVGRSGGQFSENDRELFRYLADQAARSIESVESYETVTRESVTDYLTGLKNRRAFDAALVNETMRAKRSGALGLVLIDLDNFKAINTRYLATQGDVVLREVARVLRESSREIDHPARFGGEELALVLPGTDLEGAFNVAERVRQQIDALRIPPLDGAGSCRSPSAAGSRRCRTRRPTTTLCSRPWRKP